jgi:hypothetical protein
MGACGCGTSCDRKRCYIVLRHVAGTRQEALVKEVYSIVLVPKQFRLN